MEDDNEPVILFYFQNINYRILGLINKRYLNKNKNIN